LLLGRVSVTAFPTSPIRAPSANEPQNTPLDSNAMTGGVCREVVMVLSHGVGQLLRSDCQIRRVLVSLRCIASQARIPR
jgi:hypothetical protein